MNPCGYVDCACPNCFDVAVCGCPLGEPHKPEHHLCGECEESGCDAEGDCQREEIEEE